MVSPSFGPLSGNAIIRGARCALGPDESRHCLLQIDAGYISRLLDSAPPSLGTQARYDDLDLTGFLLLPGLINAHDHLQFALYPKLGSPPYRNYMQWGEDIHRKDAALIATHHLIPRATRLWWGGIRNLLCGVTTVCHHDPLWPELQRSDFPVNVVQQYGWAHSFALGGDLPKAHKATPAGAPFILHACEGVDAQSKQELYKLDQLGVLDQSAALVHALAVDETGIDLLLRRGVSLIACPSSNDFLFGQLPPMDLLARTGNVSLGNDSPLTAKGDQLDEIRFAVERCNVPPEMAHSMVTQSPAATLRLRSGEGKIGEARVANCIAVRDTGRSPAETLSSLTMQDVEFVMIAGRVHLTSEDLRKELPFSAVSQLEPLWIDGILRWLRAPVQQLLQQAEAVLGVGHVRLGGRALRSACCYGKEI